MKKELSEKSLKLITRMQQSELTESVIYHEIAKFAKGDENKKVLERLSQEEKNHYEIWKSYTKKEMKPQKRKIFKYKLLARIFGFTFAVKLMENGEEHSQDVYNELAEEVVIPYTPEQQKVLDSIETFKGINNIASCK